MNNDEYLQQHELLHNRAKKFFSGRTAADCYRGEIKEIVLKHKPESILDYGCGKAKQYYKYKIHKSWGDYAKVPTLYDPCWGPYKEKPVGIFDGVICTDVLEHVPLESKISLDYVLEDIFNYASKFIFISLSTRKAKKVLPNGKNTHVSIFPPEWWKEKINFFRNKKKDIDAEVYVEGRDINKNKFRKRII